MPCLTNQQLRLSPIQIKISLTQAECMKIIITITTIVEFYLSRRLSFQQDWTSEIKTQTRISCIHIAIITAIDVVSIRIQNFILWIHVEQTVNRLYVVTAVVIDICTNLTVNLQIKILSQFNLRHATYGNQHGQQRHCNFLHHSYVIKNAVQNYKKLPYFNNSSNLLCKASPSKPIAKIFPSGSNKKLVGTQRIQ